MKIEDYAPTINYIPGDDNVVADTLSRNPIIDSGTDDESNHAYDYMDYCFRIARAIQQPIQWRDPEQFVTIKTIAREQTKDRYILKLQRESPDQLGEFFEDIGIKDGVERVITSINPIDKKQRIIVPETLRERVLKYYHKRLVHPGGARMFDTINQHLTWPKMREHIDNMVKNCHECQLGKRGLRGYGHVPLKDVETQPWREIAVDLSGPWKATIDKQIVVFHTLTIIDVFTGWVEIIPIENKTAALIKNKTEQEWLRRYPRPSRIIFDHGSEFDSEEFHTLCLMWYIKPVPITVKNPRANAIVERMHQVLGNMLRVQLAKLHPHDDPVKDMIC